MTSNAGSASPRCKLVDVLPELDRLDAIRDALSDGDEARARAAAAVVAALLDGKRDRTIREPVWNRLVKALAATTRAERASLATAAMTAAAGTPWLARLEKHRKKLVADPKRRPPGVPAEARYDADYELWCIAPRDAKRKWHGEVAFWRADGTLQQRCEFSHGTPHGAFTRYHESGELARTGRLARNKLDGLDTIYRSKRPSSENATLARFDPRIARVETELRRGEILAQRYFDATGKQVTHVGEPLPKRPSTVPETAVFALEEWGAGELKRGRPDGVWHYWDLRGAPTYDIVYIAGVRSRRIARHPAKRVRG